MSDVDHGFTSWESNAYDALADWRSWDAMLSVFDMILAHGDDEGEGNSSTSSLAEGDVMLEDEREFPVEEIPSLVAVERDFDFP